MDNESEIDIRSILGVLRRQLRLILGAFVVVMALASVVVFALKPVYTASALVLVDPSQKNVLDPNAQDPTSFSASSRVDGEVELARAPTVLLRVVKDAKLLEDPQFTPGPSLWNRILSFLRLRDYVTPTGEELLNDVLDNLGKAVSVQRRGLTNLISIQVQSAAPQSAADIANVVAETYISEQLDAKVNSILGSRNAIQSRIQAARAAVASSEDAVDAFVSDNIDAIAEESGRSDLTSLSDEIARTASSRNQLAGIVDTADVSLTRRDWTTLTQTLQSEAVTQLEARRRAVNASLAAAADDSQAAVDLRSELKKIEDDLLEAARNEIGSLRSAVAVTQGRVTELKSELRAGVLASDLSSTTLTRIYELQQSAEIARSQYQTLLTRLKDLDQQAFLQIADSRIVSEALPPDRPSFPNPRLLLSLAGIVGLALGIGLAFIYENLVGGIVTAEQLQDMLKSRRVLTVPRQTEPRGALSLADLLLTAPLSMYSEAVRKIRLSVDQGLRRGTARGPDQEPGHGRVILVTSAAPGEGKTTTALSLARAYAQAGLTTLLIDCDLRKPSLHKHLGFQPSTGLIDFLSGSDNGEAPKVMSIVKIDQSSGVGVVVGSRRPGAATDVLVAGQTFGRLIDASARSFDIVILDTPPIGPVVDGIYLTQFADAIVFVVKWASTPQPDVRSAVATIVEAARPGSELTMVLNQNGASSGRYSGKYADYYAEPS